MKKMKLLSVVAVFVGSSLSGCAFFEDDTPAGGLAIGRNAVGDPVVFLEVCRGTFDHIDINLMLGEGNYSVIGAYVTDDPIRPGEVHSIDLIRPGDGWRAITPLDKATGLITANAWGSEKKSGGSNQASFSFDQIARLKPGAEVMSDLVTEGATPGPDGTGSVMSLEEFSTDLC